MVESAIDNYVPAGRSNEYIQLFKELRESFTGHVDIAKRLFEQGKKDGLADDLIRKDIEAALAGVVKSRQLRNILPFQLKRKYTLPQLPDGNSTIIAELKQPAKVGVRQLAPDSISKTILVNPSVTVEPKPVRTQPVSPLLKEIEEVDESEVLQSLPDDYKIELLDQYEERYLIKIVKYLHDQNKQLNEEIKQLNDNDFRRRERIISQQDEIRKARHWLWPIY
jgi:hypothetical protein